MRLKIKVYASSGREEIIKISDTEYKVYIKKPAIHNKANLELIKILSKYFNSKVRIV